MERESPMPPHTPLRRVSGVASDAAPPADTVRWGRANGVGTHRIHNGYTTRGGGGRRGTADPPGRDMGPMGVPIVSS